MKKVYCFLFFVSLFVLVSISTASAQGVKVGGYLQTWFLSQQNEGYVNNPGVEQGTSGFRIRRARLSFKSELSEIFSVESWVEFADVQRALLDLKAIAKIAPELTVTVGQFIPPTQMNETANLLSSNLPFYEISDIASKLTSYMGHDSYRDVGIMVGGTINKMFKYGVYYGNGNGRFGYANTNIINRKFGQGLMGMRLDVEPVKGLTVGAHYSINKQDSINTGTAAAPVFSSKDRSSFSFNAEANDLGLKGLLARFEYGNGKIDEILKNAKTEYDGWYATLGYKVIPELQVLFRYDTYNETLKSTKGLADVTGKAKNMTFGTTYFFMKDNTDIVKIGLNYNIRKEESVDLRNNIFVLWTQFRIK